MARYHDVAERIRQLIAERKLTLGAPLPSERELMQLLGVNYGVVRLANQYLIGQGIIERQHGRGTFVRRVQHGDAVGDATARGTRRLGLVMVDMIEHGHPFLQNLALSLQQVAALRGYELAIEQMLTEDLIQGRHPEMMQQRLVDGVMLYGHVRDHHVQFARDMGMPALVIGNAPLSSDVPQVRLDAHGLSYEITRELLLAGRGPIWLDAKLDDRRYHLGQELLAGYREASEQFGDGSLHLCDMKPDRIMQVAQTLARSDLRQAAFIVQHWSAALLPTALRMKSDDGDRLLIASIMHATQKAAFHGDNVMQWSRIRPVAVWSEPALHGLVDYIEGQRDELPSLQVTIRCQLDCTGPVPVMHPRWAYEPLPLSPVPSRHVDAARPILTGASS